MRFQDSSTTPREPTLAEKKAREQAERRRREAADQQFAEDEQKRKKRKRMLIILAVVVIVVIVVAMGYAISRSTSVQTAQCVGEDGVIVDDSNCVTPAGSSYRGGGGYPVFIGGGGRPYYYNYGGSGRIGQRVSGGTTTVPRSGTRVTTPSGRTPAGGSSATGGDSATDGGNKSSVTRGGLGTPRKKSSGGSGSKSRRR